MLPTSPETSKTKYLLYSHYRALDMVQEMGFIPIRLFRVLFPVWRVEVSGRQLVRTEFDELEWYIERGIWDAGLDSIPALAGFFGLEINFLVKLIGFLRENGHIRGDDDHLALTQIGIDSVRDRSRYVDQKTTVEVYFEALGNKPLSAEHNKIPILENLPEKTPFQAFFQFDSVWNDATLTELSGNLENIGFQLPKENRYVQLLTRQPEYLPAYFIEARENIPSSSPRLLVFSQVRGLHDIVLEEAVNRDPAVYRALKAKTDARAESVARFFDQNGMKKDDWYLNENGPWGAQVMVDGQVFLPGAGVDQEEESGRISLRSVGRYMLIYDWCVWVMCDDPEVRKRAAVEQLLEWLQAANATPPAPEINRKLATLCTRLSIPTLPVKVLLEAARRGRYFRAAERLEELDND